MKDGEKPPKLGEDEFVGFGVDAGTACFVDDDALVAGMPDEDTWHDELFENDSPDSWFHRMDDPKHIRAGIANVRLPLAKDGANLILFRSGWGDGVFPVVGGFDARGALVAVHIDFGVVGEAPSAPAQKVRDDVECPKCGWHPTKGATLWQCDKCRAVFDTFETRAKCPKCAQSWKTTM